MAGHVGTSGEVRSLIRKGILEEGQQVRDVHTGERYVVDTIFEQSAWSKRWDSSNSKWTGPVNLAGSKTVEIYA